MNIMFIRRVSVKNILLFILSSIVVVLILVLASKKIRTIENYFMLEKTDMGVILSIWDKQDMEICSVKYMGDVKIIKISEDTLLVINGKGDWRQYTFINIATGEISDTFNDVSAWNEQKVVYAIYENDAIKIVVQDIYDKDKYYMEVVRDFPIVAVPHYVIKSAKFIRNRKIILEYYVGEDWNEKKETINLKV